MSIQPVLLGIAVASLVVGIGLFVWFSMPAREQHLQVANRIAWLLIALFPVCIIFSFFPTSTFSGTVIKGISASGAIAAFFVIWVQGARVGIKAAEKDTQTAKLKAQAAQISQLEKELRVRKAKNAPQVIDSTTRLYNLRNVKNKSIGIVTGNLTKVTFADVWVNSENTNMQMAGFFDRSVSGAIRYFGASRDHPAGHVKEDLINKELVEQLHGSISVAPGAVVWTSSGELANTHNVRGILHAAAVEGQAGVGYRQIQDIGRCVTSALEALDAKNATEQSPFRTIIFPLLGAGQGRAEPEVTARALLVAAMDHLETHPKCTITRAYFLAYTDAEKAAWDEVLGASSKRLTPA